MNNYIVTFEYRVMVTAFAILAIFIVRTSKFAVSLPTYIYQIPNVLYIKVEDCLWLSLGVQWILSVFT